jgi:hypothetical protein
MKKFNQFLEEAVTVTVTGESAEEVNNMLKLLKNESGEVDEAVKYGTTLSNNGAYNALTLGKHIVTEENTNKQELISEQCWTGYKKVPGKKKFEKGSCVKEENKSGDSSLHDWFSKSKSSDGKPGWVQLGGKYAGKSCAKQPGQTTKPKCGSSKMAANMSDKEEDAAARRKRMKDPDPNRSGKAINVATEEFVNEDACTTKVKSRYSVWPSAYASGALVKCRKVGAANWGNKTKKENVELKSFKSFINEEIEQIDEVAAWQRKEGKNPEGGLNQKGVESYRRENPGSKLSTAVTTEPSKLKAGSKAANRRKSFCARMSGMKRRLTSAKTANDPDSRINKSLRKWNC